MHQHFRKITALTSFVISVFLLGMVFYQIRVKDRRAEELLIVWGRHEAQCFLWLVNPQTIPPTSESVPGTEPCNYMVTDIGGKATLVHIHSYPAILTIYDVDNNGISTKIVLSIEGIDEITSSPQWRGHEAVYFSGIVDDEEAVYHFDVQAQILEKLISQPGNTITDACLSPDGKYLSYLILEGFSNRHECPRDFSECRSNGDYYVMDLANNESFALDSLVKLDFSTNVQHPVWSMDGQFLAVDIYSPLAPTAVIDIQRNSLVEVITGSVGTYGWLPNAQLVYPDWTNYNSPRTRVYNPKLGTSTDLVAFPSSLDDETWQLLEDLNWTKDGQHIAGTFRSNTGASRLVIVNLDGETPAVNITGYRTMLTPPKWSPSGNWIAYNSIDEHIVNGMTDSGRIGLVSKTGDAMYELDVPAMSEYEFAWVQP